MWQLTAALVSHQVSLAARYEQQLIETPSSEEYSLRYFCHFITEYTELHQVFLKLSSSAKCFDNVSVYLVFKSFCKLRLILSSIANKLYIIMLDKTFFIMCSLC